MLHQSDPALMVIDIQGKLAELMWEKENTYKNAGILIQGLQALEIPIIWTEQVPEKLGSTIPQIAELLEGLTPMPKSSFSCCGDQAIMETIQDTGRDTILLCGIETHVCVYQTCMDLLDSGYAVEVIADAVSSRSPINRQIALEEMRDIGAAITSTETVLFELLRVAGGDVFRKISKLVK